MEAETQCSDMVWVSPYRFNIIAVRISKPNLVMSILCLLTRKVE